MFTDVYEISWTFNRELDRQEGKITAVVENLGTVNEDALKA